MSRASFAWGVAALAVVLAAAAIARMAALWDENRALRLELAAATVARGKAGDVERSDPEAALPAGAPACPEPPECPAPVEVLVTPDGERLRTAPEREAWVREQLAGRLERAWQAGEIGDAERHETLDLLMRIRTLREAGGSEGELERAQEELARVTGMGVGELLERLELSPDRARAPDAAAPPSEGELRKRFPDEEARALGITTPGAVERLENGEWQAQGPEGE